MIVNRWVGRRTRWVGLGLAAALGMGLAGCRRPSWWGGAESDHQPKLLYDGDMNAVTVVEQDRVALVTLPADETMSTYAYMQPTTASTALGNESTAGTEVELLRFIVDGRTGDQRMFIGTSWGDVTATVGESYVSALGVSSRRAELQSAGGTPMAVAAMCEGGTWRFAPNMQSRL